jgi:serine phosphatase RsbU (regulator of sigma subunit)
MDLFQTWEGMDGVLIYLDPNEDHIHYAGAFNSPILVRDNSLIKCDIDKIPIGKGQNLKSFSDHHLKIQKGDILYLYSDGFPDQFGGPRNKKYSYSRLRELLLSISSKPMLEQKQILIDEFEKWKGSSEQTDDLLVVGIRF